MRYPLLNFLHAQRQNPLDKHQVSVNESIGFGHRLSSINFEYAILLICLGSSSVHFALRACQSPWLEYSVHEYYKHYYNFNDLIFDSYALLVVFFIIEKLCITFSPRGGPNSKRESDWWWTFTGAFYEYFDGFLQFDLVAFKQKRPFDYVYVSNRFVRGCSVAISDNPCILRVFAVMGQWLNIEYFDIRKLVVYSVHFPMTVYPNLPWQSKFKLIVIYLFMEFIYMQIAALIAFIIVCMFIGNALFMYWYGDLAWWHYLKNCLETGPFVCSFLVMYYVGTYFVLSCIVVTYMSIQNLVEKNGIFIRMARYKQREDPNRMMVACRSIMLVKQMTLYRIELFRMVRIMIKCNQSMAILLLGLLMVFNVPVSMVILNMVMMSKIQDWITFVLMILFIVIHTGLILIMCAFLARISQVIHGTRHCYGGLQSQLQGPSMLRAKLRLMFVHETIKSPRKVCIMVFDALPIRKSTMVKVTCRTPFGSNTSSFCSFSSCSCTLAICSTLPRRGSKTNRCFGYATASSLLLWSHPSQWFRGVVHFR